jgi:hypothetical protein
MFGETIIPGFLGRLHVIMAKTGAGAAARSHNNRADLVDVAASRAGQLFTPKITETTTTPPGRLSTLLCVYVVAGGSQVGQK